MKIVEFEDKQILSFRGADMLSVFQSIFTVNVNLFFHDETRQCAHTLILTTQGRIRMDLFLVKPNRVEWGGQEKTIQMAQDELWAVVDSRDIQEFRKIIKTYSFKRDVSWSDLTQELSLSRFWIVPFMFWPSLDQRGQQLEGYLDGVNWRGNDYEQPLDACFFDPRDPSIGI